MPAKRIDGLLVSRHLKEKIREDVSKIIGEGIEPCLATVLIGDDEASATYVKNKQLAANDVGILTVDKRLPNTTSEEELINLLNELNSDNDVHGILLQLPLPTHIDQFLAISKIDKNKDVDGLTPYNAGLLLTGNAKLKPCTPSGIMELLDYYNIDLTGMDTVIINRSNLVGKPLSLLFLQRNSTVTICHSKSRSITEKLMTADCIVTAVGDRNRFVLNGDMVKRGAVVIDVGINRIKGKLYGDVDFDSVCDKASYITPVPGGVGPMTVTMLLKNTIIAASTEHSTQL
ncbi:MAG: bifunctional 5,10-methylenetetrahydrofolate dehydrogenase/5,10-methenyltetrahydrofolate cyclohydrolase [Thermoproteota archaeon]|nr:bifunctional 5,10-methylenetetrahydrofolate dehydrogenase/5,10-methenyltetrahydrofolate cyclohydrolase [Thermoproteota archaeon]